MKTKLTATLAVLLLASASSAAMAQDRDQRGQSQPQSHPQAQHAGPPPGGGHPGGPPHMEGGQRGPGPGEHAGPPPGAFRGHEGQERAQQGPSGGPQHVGREAAPGQFGHDRGVVIPPGGRAETRGAQFAGPRGALQHWQPGRFPPVMSAQNRFRAGYYRPPYGYYSRAWGFGDFLPRPWFVHDYWLDNFLDFGLPYPPPGYTWVRVGPDALMIDRFTGRIVQVVRGIFW
jgi:Ni/Co efflux regulator RcnB